MTPEQALNVLCQVAALAPVPFSAHQQWNNAAAILQQLIKPVEVPKPIVAAPNPKG